MVISGQLFDGHSGTPSKVTPLLLGLIPNSSLLKAIWA
jgi:hypothetical protein